MQIVADNRQAVAALGESARAVGVLAQKVEVAKVKIGDMAKGFALGQAAFQAIGQAVTAIFVSLPKAAMEAERLGNAFRVLTRSAAAAAAEQKGRSPRARGRPMSICMACSVSVNQSATFCMRSRHAGGQASASLARNLSASIT